MILGVDIGGTKTLLGAFTADGTVAESIRFETPKTYEAFLTAFADAYKALKNANFTVAVAAVPGLLNRRQGIVIALGNLPWKNKPIQGDLENIIGCDTYIENDAKLAALAQAHMLNPIPERLLYVTVSTGIGTGLVYKGKLDSAMIDSEAGRMLLPGPDGKLVIWESFASGKAITKKYGKRAADITDKKAWREIAANIALGLVELCAVEEPDVIVLGGGVGSHFEKYAKYLTADVERQLPTLVRMPQIIGAAGAEQAALRGCYEFAKQKDMVYA